MYITYLKSGKLSIDPARGPVVICKEGVTEETNDLYAKRLIDAGYAVETDNEESDVDTNEDIASENDESTPPWLTDDWHPDADDAKDILKQYGIETFSVSVSKNKTVKNMIAELMELVESAN